MKSMKNLRARLRGVIWEKFLWLGSLRLHGVRYYARAGLHMNRPAVAIMAGGKFVVLNYLRADRSVWSSGEWKKLDPENPKVGFKLIPNDNTPYSITPKGCAKISDLMKDSFVLPVSSSLEDYETPEPYKGEHDQEPSAGSAAEINQG